VKDQATLDAAHKVTATEDTDGNTLVHTYQDVEPHLEYAAKMRRADSEERGVFGKRKELHHTMSVPFNVITAVAQQLGIPLGEVFDTEHSRRIYAELKSPEFALFRTTIDVKI
jgi:hypothetical protein